MLHLVEGFRTTFEVLIRNYIRRHRRPALTLAQILDLPFFIFPTETGGLGESIRVADGDTTLRNLDVGTFLEIFRLAQSNTPRELMDLMWTLVINPVTVLGTSIGGRAASEAPKWLGNSNYAHTWKTQYDEEGVPLNCASFALANWLDHGGRTDRRSSFNPLLKNAIIKVKNLHQRLGFGDRVTIFQLQTFVEKFPTYKLVMIQLNPARLEASLVMTHVGETFDSTLENNVCTLIHFNDHWALTNKVNALLKKVKNGGTYKFCEQCLCIVKVTTKQTNMPCHEEAEYQKDEKIPQPCSVDLCLNRVHPPGESCPNRSCKTCHMGFPKDKPHRCLVLPNDMGKEHPQSK